MMIQSKLARRSLSLITGALLAAGSLTAIAATQQLGSRVVIQPRDISTQFTNLLNFGELKVGPSGGTASLSSNGGQSLSVTGDVVHVAGGNEGQLGIQGEKDYTVTVSLDASFTLEAQSVVGAADLTVTTAATVDTVTLQAVNGDWNYFQIGGTLTVPANQPADVYVGTYNATVNYQ